MAEMTDDEPMIPQQRVLNGLRKRIAEGEWNHGERLPSARDLATEYNTSHGTVWKALRTLEQMNLITILDRYGTYRR